MTDRLAGPNSPPAKTTIRLGLLENRGQFALLVGLNALVGAMVGLERTVLPLIGKDEFGLTSRGAIFSFIVAFGAAKALSNLVSGKLAEQSGRKRVLVLGWTLALPVPLLIGLAPSWTLIVVANLFLGASQGLAWSMTVVMKIDLVGPRRRGLALGLNESAGYASVAVAAFGHGRARSELRTEDARDGSAQLSSPESASSLQSHSFGTRPPTSLSNSETTARRLSARSVPRSRRSRFTTACCERAHRRVSSTISTTRSPGALLRSTSQPRGRASARSPSSQPSTRRSGAWPSSARAGSRTTLGASP